MKSIFLYPTPIISAAAQLHLPVQGRRGKGIGNAAPLSIISKWGFITMEYLNNALRPVNLTAITLAVILGFGTNVARAGGLGIHVGGSVGDTLRHIDKEKNRGGKNIEEGVQATGKYLENQAHSAGDTAKAFEKRMHEGKPIDAVWHVQTDMLKATGKNTLTAMQQSSALRLVGQTAATMAGGPAGAVAFSGAYVGFAAKDVGAGLKAAAIAGATTAATGAIGKGSVKSVGDAAAKAGASGIVGGTATAASGGKFEEGFRNAALASVAHSIYKNATKVEPNPKPGTEWISKGSAAACKGVTDCKVVETSDDMRRIDSGLKATGKFNPQVKELLQFREENPLASILKSPAYEGSAVMDAANKIPYVQAGSYFHDIAMFKNEFVNVTTIPPAMVFSAIAGGAGRDAALLKQADEDAKR